MSPSLHRTLRTPLSFCPSLKYIVAPISLIISVQIDWIDSEKYFFHWWISENLTDSDLESSHVIWLVHGLKICNLKIIFVISWQPISKMQFWEKCVIKLKYV